MVLAQNTWKSVEDGLNVLLSLGLLFVCVCVCLCLCVQYACVCVVGVLLIRTRGDEATSTLPFDWLQRGD